MKTLKKLMMLFVVLNIVACGDDNQSSGYDMNSWAGIDINGGVNESGKAIVWDKLLDCRFKTSKNLHVYYQIFRSSESQDTVSNIDGGTVTEIGHAMLSVSVNYKGKDTAGFRQISYDSADVVTLETQGESAIYIKNNERILNDLKSVNELTFEIPEYNNGQAASPLNFSTHLMDDSDPIMLFIEDKTGIVRNMSRSILPGFEPITSIVITEKGNNYDHKIIMECR
jgi:hypothetical protein